MTSLALLGPQVLSIHASQQVIDEPHVTWLVGYAPERDEEDGGRVVFGTIHAAGARGVADVTVACVMGYSEEDEPGTDAFGEVLSASDALESLWDVARIALGPVAGTVDAGIEVPKMAPSAEITQLVRSDRAEVSGSEPSSEEADQGSALG